ncbi:hypothetical protein AB2T14_003697 [Clostridium botulinum]
MKGSDIINTETKITGKQCEKYSKRYLKLGIIFTILGALIAIPALPLGLIILLVGITMLMASKEYKKHSVEGIKGIRTEADDFVSTSEVPGYIKFNDNTKEILVFENLNSKKVKYSDILDFELIEDGENVVTKGGLGRAVAGGVLFGGVGAIVGGATGKRKSIKSIKSLRIKIAIRNMNNPNAYINLITNSTKTDSYNYKTSYDIAQKILSMLQIETSQN